MSIERTLNYITNMNTNAKQVSPNNLELSYLYTPLYTIFLINSMNSITCVYDNVKRVFDSKFYLEQEKSNEARSISLQTKNPVPISKDVLAGNIDSK